MPAETTDGGRVWWSQGCGASLAVCLRSYPAGRLDVPATPHAWIAILVGRPVRLWCRGDGLSHRGIAVPGDVHIVPAGMPTSWEAQGEVTSLLLAVSTALLDRVAGEEKIQGEIATRFLMRDRQIEHIGWDLKAEIEAGCPNGSLFLDSLGTAIAAHLLARHSSRALARPKEACPPPSSSGSSRTSRTTSTARSRSRTWPSWPISACLI